MPADGSPRDSSHLETHLATWPGHPSLDPADRDQLAKVIDVVRDVVGEDLIGAYLHGSAVLGGMRPRSDLDLLAVTARRMTRDQKVRLVADLFALSGPYRIPGPPRAIELTAVVASEIRPWRYPPSMDFQLGEWLRERLERGEVDPLPSRTHPDVAVLVTMVLQGDAAVAGPPPTEVFDPVPPSDFRRALSADVPGLLAELELDTRNVVLTLARIWSGLVTGAVHSKDAAADWALPRLPAEHRAVLAFAREAYLGTEDEDWMSIRDRICPYADAVVGEIEAAKRGER
jgi:predicted nucleotidyltransferase